VAKGGGGAWKVAYADFVTAMMAFFLVMWLCAQNTEVKKSVSDYFNDPTGIMQGGDGHKKPNRTGSVTPHLGTGSVPLHEKVALGKGRKAYSSTRFINPATRLIRDWLHQDEKANQYWNKQVEDQLVSARRSKETKEKGVPANDIAVRRLAAQLKDELVGEIPAKSTGIYRELLLEALGEVNWTELAEDLVGQ
jgi:flagellar motor protein MotB